MARGDSRECGGGQDDGERKSGGIGQPAQRSEPGQDICARRRRKRRSPARRLMTLCPFTLVDTVAVGRVYIPFLSFFTLSKSVRYCRRPPHIRHVHLQAHSVSYSGSFVLTTRSPSVVGGVVNSDGRSRRTFLYTLHHGAHIPLHITQFISHVPSFRFSLKTRNTPGGSILSAPVALGLLD